eukprot:5794491-Amphidinium_carterae.1
MGAGKGYVMKWLSQQAVFPLENVVRIDPDHFKTVMPEWKGYTERDGSTAGTLCHKESGFMQELAQEVAMRDNQNVCIDGSLKDHKWYTELFKDLRKRFPRYRVAIISVRCEIPKAVARAAERGQQTGRHVPQEKIEKSAEESLESVKVLGTLADFVVHIQNDGKPWVEACQDHSHSLRPLQRMFQLHRSEKEMLFPAFLRPRVIERAKGYCTKLTFDESVWDTRRE